MCVRVYVLLPILLLSLKRVTNKHVSRRASFFPSDYLHFSRTLLFARFSSFPRVAVFSAAHPFPLAIVVARRHVKRDETAVKVSTQNFLQIIA